jgi:hypothetical protein
MRLIKEIQAANRQDLVNAAERLADFIQDYLDRGKPVPIINIIGSTSAGKSLFWDFVTQKLLGPTAIFIDSKSESHPNERVYETWKSLTHGKNEDLTLFFCNVRTPPISENHMDLSGLETGAHQTYGDVVILTNGWQGFIPEKVKQLEINLTVMNSNAETMFPSQLSYACNF